MNDLTRPRELHSPDDMLACIRAGTPAMLAFTGPNWSSLVVIFTMSHVTFRPNMGMGEHSVPEVTLTKIGDLARYLEAWERRAQ